MSSELVGLADAGDRAAFTFPAGRSIAASGTDTARPLVDEALRALARLKALALQPPCAVFLGDRNAGKSTAVNMLIGTGLLPTNIVASTRHPTLLRFAARPSLEAVMADGRRQPIRDATELAELRPAMLEVGLPVARLKRFAVLDTPAGFAPERLAHLPGLPSQLMTVWCTLSTQAWKASEEKAWLDMDVRLRRHSVLSATAIDRIAAPRDRARLIHRINQAASGHFRAIAVSGRNDDQPGDHLDSDEAGRPLADVLEQMAGDLRTRRTHTIERLCARIVLLAGLDRIKDDDEDAAAGPLPAFIERLMPAATVATRRPTGIALGTARHAAL